MATEKTAKNKPRRIALWLLIAAIVLFGGIYALRGVLIAPLAVAFLEHTVEANLGLKISIGGLGGSYFSNIEVKNVTTVKRLNGGPLANLQLHRLKLNYRLWDFLGGLPSFLAGSSIVLDGARLSIDLTVEMESDDDQDTLKDVLRPSLLTRIGIHDSSLQVTGSGYETRFDGISFTARSAQPGESQLQLRVAQWSWHHPDLRETSVALEADFSYADESLMIEKLLIDKQEIVKSATIGLGGMPQQIPFEMVLNLAGGELNASGRLDSNRLHVALSGSDIDLRRISELLDSGMLPFGGRLSLQGQLNLLLSDPRDLIGDLKIQVLNGSVQDTSLEQLSFSFLADGRYLRVKDLQLINSSNQLSISRASVPLAIVLGADLDSILKSLAVDWHLEGTNIPSLLKIAGVGFGDPAHRIPPHRLILNGRMKDGKLMIPLGRLDVEGGYILLEAADITLPIGEQALKDSTLVGDLSVDLPEAEMLSQIFALPLMGGAIKGKIKVSGTLLAPQGTVSISGRALTYRNKMLGNFSINAQADTRSVVIESAILERGKDRAVGRGTLMLAEKSFNNVEIELSIVDLAPYFSELFLGPGPPPEKAPDVAGILQGRLHAAGDFMHPDAEADLRVENFRFNDFQLKQGNIRLKSTGRQIGIESAELTLERHRLQLAGDIQRNADDTEFIIALKKVSIIGQSILLALERTATCRLFRNGRIIFDNVALAGSAGRVSFDGLFEPAGSSDLRVVMSDLTGDGWFDLIFSERIRFKGLDARLRVSGQASAPFFALQGTVDNLGSREVPMAFSGRFNVEYSNKVFKIHEFAWQGTEGQQVQLSGTLPLDPVHPDVFISGPIALEGRARIDDTGVLAFITPWAERSGGSIQCDFNLSGTWKSPNGRLHLALTDLNRPADIQPLPPGPYSVTGDLLIDGDRLTLESLEAYSSGWKAQIQGYWHGAPTLPDLMGAASPKASGRLNLSGSLSISDLSWVAREVGGVRRLTGRLEAQGALKGPITAPAADAVIKLFDVEFAPDFDMPSLRGLNLEAAVTPEALNVRSLTGELGGAPFELTGSWKLTAGTGPGTDLRLRGENLLLYRSESLRLRADTDLTLKGPLARLELAGEVAVTDGRFSKNFGALEGFAAAGKSGSGKGFQLFSIHEPPWRDMRFNVRMTAKKPFLLRNNLLRGSVRPNLVLAGTGEIPLLTGNVYVESTRLYLPAGHMQLETGLVRFDKADPDRPRLDLIGTATMLGYDITAVIEGPYDEPVITLSSIPPLPNEDLLMLVLAGQPPKSSTARSNATRQGLNVAVFLGRDLLTRLSDDDSAEGFESILDRFDVEVGRAITRRGEDTIHSQFRVADDVLVGGDSLYLTGERDYFDYFNGGIKLVFRFR